MQKREIIDGLQRLEAIISFILNKYPVNINGENQYFNLAVYPRNGILIKRNELKQEDPVMDEKLCSDFLLYQLPISIINADKTVVDDVFKRINSTGRKLSSQDLRQAGITSKFSDLVRMLSTHIRGDASEDILEMNDIHLYSLSSRGLNYGVDIKEVFWVKQGIITEDALRRSKDEEVIAILCSSILSNYSSGMSVKTLNRLYDISSSNYKRNETILTQSKCNDITNLFVRIINDMEKIFSVNNTTFSNLLFKDEKSYNKDLVFIILFLTFVQLYAENYKIDNYDTINELLNNIANSEFSEIITNSDCNWNTEVRNHLIERLKNILVKHMVFNENNPEWNKVFINFLKQITVENQLYDFKIGFHDLRNGSENDDLIYKCVKTLVAMANTSPLQEGVIIVGIADKESDINDYKTHYNTSSPSYNNFYVPGIVNEANKYYGSIGNYICHLKNTIENNSCVSNEIKYKILTSIDTIRYEKQTLLVLKLSTDKPLFYDGKLYVRYQSHNKEILNGTEEFYALMNKFFEKKSL